MTDQVVTLEAMGVELLGDWLAQTRAEYIAERIEAGDSTVEATTNADDALRRMFPDGRPAPGQHVCVVLAGGRPVGHLWVGPAGSEVRRWWVWNVAIDEAERGAGHGRATMRLAEELARQHGAESIGLNVFARNAVARGLYRSLGYEETSVQMRKDLGA